MTEANAVASPEAPSTPFEYHAPGGLTNVWYWGTWSFIHLVARTYFRLSIRGARNFPKSGPVLIVANHASWLDPPLLAAAAGRRLAFFAKAELWEKKLTGMMLSWFGAFPVRRGEGDRNAIRQAIAVLKKGHPLVFFPEGNRSSDGMLGEAKTGVAMILAQVPETQILPVRIDGSFAAYGKGAKYPKPAKISLTVGKPFRISDLKGLPTAKKQLYHEIGRLIMLHIENAEP